MHLRFKDGKSKVLTLSYDDCVVQDMRFMKILNEYGLKCTFHICTGLYWPEGRKRDKFEGQMTLSEAKALYIGSGHEIACHTLTHPRLDLIEDENEIRRQLLEDKRNVESQYGTAARGMAYPCGAFNDRVVEIAKECGFCYSKISQSTFNFDLPKDWMKMPTTLRHGITDKLEELSDKFVNEAPAQEECWMFSLRGHSYEFDNDDNWELIENFAKKVGRRDDVWYAPLIEIYDYVKAYEGLRVSDDGKAVFNPSHLDVWVGENGKTLCIKSGQSVILK